MESFPPNSQKSKATNEPEEPRKVPRVTTGEVVQRKKTLSKRFTETFVGGDAKSAVSYVIFDVMVPAARDTIQDGVTTFMEQLLFGTSRGGGSRRPTRISGPGGFQNYSRISGGGAGSVRREDPRGPAVLSRRSSSTHTFDDIILESRAEGLEVLSQMDESLSKYSQVTLSDLKDMVGITSNYTDQKWGWIDLRDAKVTKIREGYWLDLPKLEEL